MTTTTLVFESINEIWKFKTVCKLNTFNLNADQYSITAEFSEEEIELAVSEFRARLIVAKAEDGQPAHIAPEE
jgi:hypothetical protein